MNYEETVEQFCDNYCKYPLTCADEDALAEKCDACPICKLAEQLEVYEQKEPSWKQAMLRTFLGGVR